MIEEFDDFLNNSEDRIKRIKENEQNSPNKQKSTYQSPRGKNENAPRSRSDFLNKIKSDLSEHKSNEEYEFSSGQKESNSSEKIQQLQEQFGELVIMEEEIDDGYEPTQQEIIEYAQFLGIDIQNEQEYFYLAREGLKCPLPEQWKPAKPQNSEQIIYINLETGEYMETHPCEVLYRQKFAEIKQDHLQFKKNDSQSDHTFSFQNQDPNQKTVHQISKLEINEDEQPRHIKQISKGSKLSSLSFNNLQQISVHKKTAFKQKNFHLYQNTQSLYQEEQIEISKEENTTNIGKQSNTSKEQIDGNEINQNSDERKKQFLEQNHLFFQQRCFDGLRHPSPLGGSKPSSSNSLNLDSSYRKHRHVIASNLDLPYSNISIPSQTHIVTSNNPIELRIQSRIDIQYTDKYYHYKHKIEQFFQNLKLKLQRQYEQEKENYRETHFAFIKELKKQFDQKQQDNTEKQFLQMKYLKNKIMKDNEEIIKKELQIQQYESQRETMKWENECEKYLNQQLQEYEKDLQFTQNAKKLAKQPILDKVKSHIVQLKQKYKSSQIEQQFLDTKNQVIKQNEEELKLQLESIESHFNQEKKKIQSNLQSEFLKYQEMMQQSQNPQKKLFNRQMRIKQIHLQRLNLQKVEFKANIMKEQESYKAQQNSEQKDRIDQNLKEQLQEKIKYTMNQLNNKKFEENEKYNGQILEFQANVQVQYNLKVRELELQFQKYQFQLENQDQNKNMYFDSIENNSIQQNIIKKRLIDDIKSKKLEIGRISLQINSLFSKQNYFMILKNLHYFPLESQQRLEYLVTEIGNQNYEIEYLKQRLKTLQGIKIPEENLKYYPIQENKQQLMKIEYNSLQQYPIDNLDNMEIANDELICLNSCYSGVLFRGGNRMKDQVLKYQSSTQYIRLLHEKNELKIKQNCLSIDKLVLQHFHQVTIDEIQILRKTNLEQMQRGIDEGKNCINEEIRLKFEEYNKDLQEVIAQERQIISFENCLNNLEKKFETELFGTEQGALEFEQRFNTIQKLKITYHSLEKKKRYEKYYKQILSNIRENKINGYQQIAQQSRVIKLQELHLEQVHYSKFERKKSVTEFKDFLMRSQNDIHDLARFDTLTQNRALYPQAKSNSILFNQSMKKALQQKQKVNTILNEHQNYLQDLKYSAESTMKQLTQKLYFLFF